MKALILVRSIERVVVDIGDVPIALLKDLLVKNHGTFDGNWTPGDLGKPEYIVESVEVNEAP